MLMVDVMSHKQEDMEEGSGASVHDLSVSFGELDEGC